MKKVFLMMVMGLSMVVAQAATKITIDEYVCNYSNGEYMFALTSEDGYWQVTYYIQVAKDKLENGKVYTLAEMAESYAVYSTGGIELMQAESLMADTHMFTAATFKIENDEEKKTCVIEATFTSKKDGETYELNYDGKMYEDMTPPPPFGPGSEEEEATMLQANRYTYQESDKVWMVFVDDEKLMFRIGLNEEAELGKTYDWEDMNQGECRAICDKGMNSWMENFTKAQFIYSEDGNGGVALWMRVKTEDHGIYDISYSDSALPEAIDTTKIVIDGAVFEEQLGMYSVRMAGKNEQYAVTIKCNVNTDEFVGEYKGLGIYNEYGKIDKDLSGLWKFQGKDSVAVKLAYAETLLEETEDGNYRMKAYLQDEERHGYAVVMTSAPVAANDTIELKASNLEQYDHTDMEKPQVSYTASNEEYRLSLWVYGDGKDGVYKGSQIVSCSIYSTDEGSEWSTLLQYGVVTISHKDDALVIEGEVLMDDQNRYMLKLSDKEIEDEPIQGVEDVMSEKGEVRKEMREGRVVIVSGGRVYGLMGSKLLDEGQRP